MTTRKRVFYGILALVSLLGLGITQSASAGDIYYKFTGTVSGSIWNPFDPNDVPISFSDPMTGFASYDPSMGRFGVQFFAEDTSNGFTWSFHNEYADVLSLNPLQFDLPDGSVGGARTFGGLYFGLDYGFDYFALSARGRIESVRGDITSFQR